MVAVHNVACSDRGRWMSVRKLRLQVVRNSKVGLGELGREAEGRTTGSDT
jgi:hypothetical protein